MEYSLWISSYKKMKICMCYNFYCYNYNETIIMWHCVCILQDNVDSSKLDLSSFAYTPQRRKPANDTTLQQQHPAICNNDLNTYRKPLALYGKNDRQNNHTFPTKFQNASAVTKRDTDWPELDMYANIRQSHSTGNDKLKYYYSVDCQIPRTIKYSTFNTSYKTLDW